MANVNIRAVMQSPNYTFTDIYSNKVHISSGIDLSSFGFNLGTQSPQQGKAIIPNLVYDDTGFLRFVIPVPSVLRTDQLVQADESDEIIGVDVGGGVFRHDFFTDAQGTTGRDVQKFTFKGGTVTPTTDATVTFHAALSAGEISPDNAFFSFDVLAGNWPANFQELSVQTGGQLGFSEGERFAVRIEASDAFSMRTNAAKTQPWQKEDHQLTTEFDIPFANVPYASWCIDQTTPGVTNRFNFAAADTEYDFDIFCLENPEDAYQFTLDENTGIYTFNGLLGNYDGTFYTSMIGSTTNMVLNFHLYINSGSGFTEALPPFPYEVNSAGARSATIPTKGLLSPGDQIKVTLECSKTGYVDFVFGEKKIRGYSKGAPT